MEGKRARTWLLRKKEVLNARETQSRFRKAGSPELQGRNLKGRLAGEKTANYKATLSLIEANALEFAQKKRSQ